MSLVTGKAGLRAALLAVVLGYTALTLAVTDLHRDLAYDEAIYLSQVYSGPPLPFTAPRARGLPLLLTPLGWFDAPVPVVRCYLLNVSAALMYLGFNAWLPALRGRAVIAAAVFGIGWLPLFYSTEAFPNLPVAFGAVAAAGYLARYLVGTSGRGALVACSAVVALMALVRPTEALFVTVGLWVIAVTRPGRELALRWGLPVLGLAVGCMPWLVEAHLRFGGPLHRMRAAFSNVGGGFHPENVRHQLSFTDGPASGSVRDDLPWLGALWWSLIVIAVMVLVVRRLIGRADRTQRAGAVAAVVGVATATQYLFLVQVQEARFLLPAYAILTVALVAAVPSHFGNPVGSPAGSPVGRRQSAHRRTWRPVSTRILPGLLATALLALLTVFAGWQIDAVERVGSDQATSRALADRLTDVVRQHSAPPCVVSSEVAFPVIAFGAGCRGAPFRPESPDITVAVGSDRTALPSVYVLTTTNPAQTGVHPLPGSVRALAADGAPGWWLFVATPNEVVATSNEAASAL